MPAFSFGATAYPAKKPLKKPEEEGETPGAADEPERAPAAHPLTPLGTVSTGMNPALHPHGGATAPMHPHGDPVRAAAVAAANMSRAGRDVVRAKNENARTTSGGEFSRGASNNGTGQTPDAAWDKTFAHAKAHPSMGVTNAPALGNNAPQTTTTITPQNTAPNPHIADVQAGKAGAMERYQAWEAANKGSIATSTTRPGDITATPGREAMLDGVAGLPANEAAGNVALANASASPVQTRYGTITPQAAVHPSAAPTAASESGAGRFPATSTTAQSAATLHPSANLAAAATPPSGAGEEMGLAGETQAQRAARLAAKASGGTPSLTAGR